MKTNRTHMTNTEFVTELMEFSRFGALSQPFIIEAIQRYADSVASADPEALANPFVNEHAWIGVAKEIKERAEAKYGPLRQEKSFRGNLLDVIHFAEEAQVDGHDIEQVKVREKCLDQVRIVTGEHDGIDVDDQEIELLICDDHNSAMFKDVAGQSHNLTLRMLVRQAMSSRDFQWYRQLIGRSAEKAQQSKPASA